jgi:hypothetical protein
MSVVIVACIVLRLLVLNGSSRSGTGSAALAKIAWRDRATFLNRSRMETENRGVNLADMRQHAVPLTWWRAAGTLEL